MAFPWEEKVPAGRMRSRPAACKCVKNPPPVCCAGGGFLKLDIKNPPPDWARDSIGAGDEARTRYLHLGKVALYRMSYTRIYYLMNTSSSMVPPVGIEPTTRGFSVRCSTY